MKIIVIYFSLIALFPVASAHGVIINHIIDPATGEVLVNGTFDTGEIMSGAQVAIFAPNDPATPWRVAEADELGNYRFSPDSTLPGRWEVQLRKAGHGDILRLELNEGTLATLAASAGGASGFTTAQIVIMSASIIWGFVGTAFYFAARQKTRKETTRVELAEGLA